MVSGDFADRIKKMEDELLALKTASPFTSIRNVNITHAETVYTGVYLVEYETNGEEILSSFYSDMYKRSVGSIDPRTPGATSQYVDVFTTSYDTSGNPSTRMVSFSVISNVPVKRITRVS